LSGDFLKSNEADFHRIANLPQEKFVSEEDVKTKIILPILHALGYEDADFNFEARTGRGYVDIVVEHFPVGIVVETKAPRTSMRGCRNLKPSEHPFSAHPYQR
jgi:hypothetical protein